MRVLLIVVVIASSACASSGFTPRPFPKPGQPSRTVPPPVTSGAQPAGSGYEISGTALSLRGAPYRSGGADPRGFDCSGLVWYVFAQHGYSLPRTVSEQYRIGTSIDTVSLEPGDLVFFSTSDPGASHVGIVIGGDSFVHAPSYSGVVRVERMSASYWAARFVGARRVL